MVCDPLFEIVISNRARKSLRRLPHQYARRAILAFEALKQNSAPVPEFEAKKLRGLKDDLSFWFSASFRLAVLNLRRPVEETMQLVLHIEPI